jgi:hypothetical protein
VSDTAELGAPSAFLKQETVRELLDAAKVLPPPADPPSITFCRCRCPTFVEGGSGSRGSRSTVCRPMDLETPKASRPFDQNQPPRERRLIRVAETESRQQSST